MPSETTLKTFWEALLSKGLYAGIDAVQDRKNMVGNFPSGKAVEAATKIAPNFIPFSTMERMLKVAYAIDFAQMSKEEAAMPSEPSREAVEAAHEAWSSQPSLLDISYRSKMDKALKAAYAIDVELLRAELQAAREEIERLKKQVEKYANT